MREIEGGVMPSLSTYASPNRRVGPASGAGLFLVLLLLLWLSTRRDQKRLREKGGTWPDVAQGHGDRSVSAVNAHHNLEAMKARHGLDKPRAREWRP